MGLLVRAQLGEVLKPVDFNVYGLLLWGVLIKVHSYTFNTVRSNGYNICSTFLIIIFEYINAQEAAENIEGNAKIGTQAVSIPAINRKQL